MNACPLHSASYRRGDRFFRLEAPNRGVHTQKQSTALTTRSTTFEVGRYGFADGYEQGQWGLLGAFAVNGQSTILPIDIVQGQRGDLSRSQAEARQRHQHRIVAPTDRAATIATGEYAPRILGR